MTASYMARRWAPAAVLPCGARLQACEPACGCEEAWFRAAGVVEEGSRSCVGRIRIRTPGGVRHEEEAQEACATRGRGGGARSCVGEAAFARLEACATAGARKGRVSARLEECATRGRGALAAGDRVMRLAVAACGCPRDSVFEVRIDEHANVCTKIHLLMLIAVASGGRMRRVRPWWR